MTCIKTGARVHFTNYGQVLSADLFMVNDAIVVRVNKENALENQQGFDIAPEEATHEVTAPPGGENEFWRDDLGVFVVPIECVKERTSNGMVRMG